MDDDKTVKTLEEIAGKTFNTEAEKHKAAIRDLPDARREAYRKLRRQAAKPEPEELELPDIYETVIDEDSLFSDHLYADEKREFQKVSAVPKSLLADAFLPPVSEQLARLLRLLSGSGALRCCHLRIILSAVNSFGATFTV